MMQFFNSHCPNKISSNQLHRFGAHIVFSFAILITIASSVYAAESTGPLPESRPNIIMIVTDDLGWGDLGVYGHPKVKTPHLDKMAREGRLFTQFYMNSPVCSPSRAAILTGRYPAEIGINYAIGAKAGDDLNASPWLSTDLPNLYRSFQSHGYRTAHFGKWHLGDHTRRGVAPPPHKYGIDVSGTTNSTGQKLSLNGAVVTEETLDTRRLTGRNVPRSQSTEIIVDNAIAFIDHTGEQPFLMSLWTLEPHAVLDPTLAQMKAYLDLTHPKVRGKYHSMETVYYSSLSNIDRHVGRLLNALDDRGLSENTIVIFTSDNGPSPGWSKATGHAGAGLAGPFRGVKGSLYEGGLRVPLIVKWPKKVAPNQIDETSLITAVDLFPSLAAIAGVKLGHTSETLNGENLSTALLTAPKLRSKPVFWEYRAGSWGRDIQVSPRLAMRDGNWKLLMNPDGSRVELYNLAIDIRETSNVANYEPERLKAMQTALLEWFNTKVPETDRVAGHAGQFQWKWPKTRE